MSADALDQSPTRPSDLKRVLVLLLLALAVRAWTVANTTVPSRDCIVFVRDGLQLENPTVEPTRAEFLRKRAEHPPGYPAAIIAMSWIVRPMMGGTTVEAMALSAQLVSLVSGVLLVIPLFLIARRLFDRNVAFAATAIFTVLPVCVEVTSDGISDGLFLLTAAWGLWFGLRTVEQTTLGSAAITAFLAGIFCGLGYLVRPDAAVVGTSIGLVLLAQLARGLLRKKWKTPLVAGVLLLAGAGLAISPYCVTIGGLSKKATFTEIFNRLRGKPPEQTYYNRDEANRGGSNVLLAAWWSPTENAGESKPLWALKALASEYAKSAFYCTPFLAIIGLMGSWRRLAEAKFALLWCTILIHVFVLWILAWFVNYVSQRHTLLTVMLTCVLAGAALPVIGEWIRRSKSAWFQRKTPWQIGAGIAVLVILPAVARDAQSLHHDRAGYKAAGRWLKERGDPAIPIVDPFGWAEWYSGRALKDYPNPNPTAERELYIIFEPNPKSHHSRLGTYDFAKQHYAGQEIIYAYPEGASPEKIQVAVYHFRPEKSR
jgi:hypothetical protein